MQIQIRWLLQKPSDLDLHCLQRQGISGFSRTRVKSDKSLDNIGLGLIYVLYISTTLISKYHVKMKILGPVVQSVVSLTSSLRVISLTVLADSIYNILKFFAEKNVSSFCTAKATHIFSAKNYSIFAYHSM